MTIIFRRLAHYAVYLVAGLAILASCAALVLRFLIMPNIGNYKSEIEASASGAVGIPVRIAEIRADWQHFNPRISLRNITLTPAGQPSTLQLTRVDASLSWWSLVLLEPHLANLDIARPTLEIRHLKTGGLLVAGIPINTSEASSPFPDWLLRQRSVTITDGKLIWIDDALKAPPLMLEHVNLGLLNRFGRHRFGLTAQPPVNAAHLIDIRGDLRGRTVHDLQGWRGQLYLRADDTSAAALNTWAPWAQSAVRRSLGNVRFWMDLAQGQIQKVSGDVSLTDVAVSLANDRPDMTFARISGHLDWSRIGNEQTYSVKGLRFVTPAGTKAEPADVKAIFTPTAAGKVESIRVVADSLRLEALTALSGAVPLPRQVHDWIASVNPRGFIEHIDFNWLGKNQFRLQTRFRDAGMNATRNLPGLTGLSGDIDADEHKGEARLNSQSLHIVYAKIFRQPLDLSQLASVLRWTYSDAAGYRFDLVHCELSNPDLDGSVQGTLTLPPRSSPVADIQARVTRGNGDAVWRYLPYQVAGDAYIWLKRSIVGGTSPQTTLTLRGPLDHYPFDKGGGLFEVDVEMRNGVLDYAPGWPRITGINGLLTFRNNGMTIDADSGAILGVQLKAVHGVIPDLFYTHDQVLTLTGQANGPTPAFLDFIQQSPVNEYMGHFTDAMQAVGEGALNLKLTLPLSHMDDTQVAGRFSFNNNAITLDKNFPQLTDVAGVFNFTNTSLKSAGLTANLFGEPLSIALASGKGGQLHAGVNGNVNATTLSRWLPGTLARRLSGIAPVQAEITLKQHALDLKLGSSLAGLAIDLPAPLGKTADETRPFTLSTENTGGESNPVSFQYGSILAGNLIAGDTPEHTRLAVMLGGQAAPVPTEPGITVLGNLRHLDFDVWRHLDLGGAGSGLPVNSVNLTFNELLIFNRLFHDINVQAVPDQRAWKLTLNGTEAQGVAHYGPQPGSPGDSLTGQFKKLDIPPVLSASTDQGAINPDDLPKQIDLAVQSFAYNKQHWGELAVKVTSAHDGLSLNSFTLKTPESQLEASGWLSASPLRTTRIDAKLNSSNVGQAMLRLGYDEDIKGGELSAQGTLNWRGRPENFELSHLNGSIKLELKNGRFTHLDPGAAKLLGILSLQMLPRRITLDFRDIFSAGLAFDSIDGNVLLDRGVSYLPDLYIQGPAAKIHMKGQINLVREDQDLRLHIEPRLDEGLAVAGAFLGGPVVGVGALVATKILKNPISQAASFEYLVNGTWADPVVSKLARPVATNVPSRP